MSRATFFIRECPTCGRRLQIRVEYLGRLVRCKHCEARFERHDPSAPVAPEDSAVSLLDARTNCWRPKISSAIGRVDGWRRWNGVLFAV